MDAVHQHLRVVRVKTMNMTCATNQSAARATCSGRKESCSVGNTRMEIANMPIRSRKYGTVPYHDAGQSLCPSFFSSH